jgi:DNA-binding protein H-NS
MFGQKPPTPPNLLPFDKLLALKHQIDAEVERRKEAEIAKVTATLATFGIAIGAPAAETAKKKQKRKAQVKYQNPHNHAETWTGRGRPPKWLADFVEQGHKIEDFGVAAGGLTVVK